DQSSHFSCRSSWPSYWSPTYPKSFSFYPDCFSRDCHNVQQSQEETMKHTWLKHTAQSALAAAGLALALQTGAMAQTELRIGHGHTEEHSFHLGLQKFVELLEQKAPGAFDATIF